LPEREAQPLSPPIQSQNPSNEKVKTTHPPEEIDKRGTSSPLTVLPQPTQDQPPSRQSLPEPPSPSEQTSSEDHKPPTLETHEELDTLSQKSTNSDPSLPVLLARAEQRVASLREAAEGLTIEIDRLNEEGTELTPRGTRNARRATFLLNHVQRHTDALSQALLHLENNPTDQTPVASANVTTLLKQTYHYETLLRKTATRLHAEAHQQSKEVLQDQIPQPASLKIPHDQQPERPDMDIAQIPQTVKPSEHAEVIPPQQHPEFSLSTLTTHRDVPNESPLMLAALRGDRDAVDRLIAQGAEVNDTNRAGGTALMTAAIQGHSEVVRLLISKKATVNAKNNKGWTALMYAAWNGHTDVVKMLLAKGAEINAQNNEGWTALMYATWKGQIATVQVLLAGRALVTTPNQAGESALTLAAHRGHGDITALLNDADGKQ
jgi:ankyrin repeat protein